MVNDAGRKVTLVLRLSLREGGQVTGVVERVSTGEKRQIHDLEAIGPVITGMVLNERGPASGSASRGSTRWGR